ncbi:MAG: stage 0 sporulation protein [Candidatus Sabulitectum sp.]|nr:stage 0 sporulation protein [Candidatus Sabulitectum sp.]
MKEEDARRMEKQPIEVIQLAFKARRLLMFANRTLKPVDMGETVIVSVDRGEDIGRVVAKLHPCESNMEHIEGNFLRLATEQDLKDSESNREFEKEVLEHCRERVKSRNLDMHLTACESQLDRNRIRIFFTADQRADFRGLVRDMASSFRARIEMRQIGVRDDAKYKDGVGICGRQLCCAGFLNEFKSVTLKSVRDQHLSPNPSKVSGACRRLMCCLEYETEFYRKASKTYPRAGLKLKVNGLPASVSSVDIFRETVTLLWEEKDSEEVLPVEEFHRRRTMSSMPPEVVEKPGSTQGKIYGNTQAPAVKTAVNKEKEKTEKKTRSRGRGRYRRKNNRSEERKS